MTSRQTVRMASSKHVVLVKPAVAPALGSPDVRTALETLRRLRTGWRPGERLLAHARRAERWSVTRQAGAPAYQFVGTVPRSPMTTSLTIATVLALDLEEGWALVFSDRWIRLGEPSPEMPPFDAAEVAARAERWLLSLAS